MNTSLKLLVLAAALSLPAAGQELSCEPEIVDRYSAFPCPDRACDELSRGQLSSIERSCVARARELLAAPDPAPLELDQVLENLDRLLLTSSVGSYGYKARFPRSLADSVRSKSAAAAKADALCPAGLVRRREPVVCADNDQNRCASFLMGYETACAELHARSMRAWRAGGPAPVAALESALENALEVRKASKTRPGVIYGLNDTQIASDLIAARGNPAVAPPAGGIMRPEVPLEPAPAPSVPSAPSPERPAPRRAPLPYLLAVLAAFGAAGFLFARARQDEGPAAPRTTENLAYVPVTKRAERPDNLRGLETLREAYEKRGPFEPAFVRRVMAQACALAGAVHASGHGHGGISPDCLVFDSEGVLTLLPPQPLRSFDPCSAPEGVAGPRADVFSLGATAYFLLAGRAPFDDSGAKADGDFVPASVRRTTLPLSLDLFFRKALAPEPGERFADAAEFRAAFDKALDNR